MGGRAGLKGFCDESECLCVSTCLCACADGCDTVKLIQ